MRILIYGNTGKPCRDEWLFNLKTLLEKEKTEYRVIERKDLGERMSADALFVFGGDGTILRLAEFSSKNNIPVIGINAGKLGFLSEFEICETEKAYYSLKNGQLKKDQRLTLSVIFGNKEYIALNDAVIQRVYSEEYDGSISNIEIFIDSKTVDKVRGDGVIVSTPTGSTAYSLSAGGAILAPGINAHCITPISAHSLHHRPIIYSADSDCRLLLKEGCSAGLFVDGKLVENLHCKDSVLIKKSKYSMTFYRKESSDFYDRLLSKLNVNFNRG